MTARNLLRKQTKLLDCLTSKVVGSKVSMEPQVHGTLNIHFEYQESAL